MLWWACVGQSRQTKTVTKQPKHVRKMSKHCVFKGGSGHFFGHFSSFWPPSLTLVHWIGDSESRIGRIRIGRFKSCDSKVAALRLGVDGSRFGLQFWIEFCDSTSRRGNSGDSWPAILGIMRFVIRVSVPLRSGPRFNPRPQHLTIFHLILGGRRQAWFSLEMGAVFARPRAPW